MKINRPETQRVVDALTSHKILWARTFAPMRRAIAGQWSVNSAGAGLKLNLDADGHFGLVNGSAGLTTKGRYAIAKVEKSLYLVLDAETICYVLRIEEFLSGSMKLTWADENSAPVWLEKIGASEVSPTLRVL